MEVDGGRVSVKGHHEEMTKEVMTRSFNQTYSLSSGVHTCRARDIQPTDLGVLVFKGDKGGAQRQAGPHQEDKDIRKLQLETFLYILMQVVERCACFYRFYEINFIYVQLYKGTVNYYKKYESED